MRENVTFLLILVTLVWIGSCSPEAGDPEKEKTDASVKPEKQTERSTSAKTSEDGPRTNASPGSGTPGEPPKKKLTDEQKKRLEQRLKQARKRRARSQGKAGPKSGSPKTPSVSVSDEELRKLARLAPRLQKLGRETRKKMKKTVRDSKMKEKRFQEISKSKRSKEEQVKLSENEKALYQDLVQKLQKINRAGRKRHRKLVREAGFEPSRLRKLATAMKQDQELRRRFMQIRSSMENAPASGGTTSSKSGGDETGSSSPPESSSDAESSSDQNDAGGDEE